MTLTTTRSQPRVLVELTDPATGEELSLDISVELISPLRAKEWLALNPLNRSLRKVDTYGRDMTHGQWYFTGETIKFDRNGNMIDGQHRCHAIVQSDVTIPVLVVRGLDPAAQHVMDAGMKRTGSDALKLKGEKNTGLLNSVAGMIINTPNRKDPVTHSEVFDLLEADPSLRVIVSEIMPPLKLNSLMSGTVACYAYWKLMQIDPEATAEFFLALSSLVGLPAGSPILALHRRLGNTITKGSRGVRGGFNYRQEVLACIFQAWNAWRSGKTQGKIQVSYGEFGRIQIPEPK